MMYIATHKQTGQKKAGTFEELQDLDKRIWNLKEFVNPLTVTLPKPLCIINVYARPRHAAISSDKPFLVQRRFFNHSQFEGIYLGG